MNVALRFISLVVIFLSIGCASTIGNPTDISQTSFQIGVSQKTEIANVLGYPEYRAVADQLEYWGYPDRPELTGVIYAVPTGNNTVTTYSVSKINSPLEGMPRAAVIYIFDDEGTLVDVQTRDGD